MKWALLLDACVPEAPCNSSVSQQSCKFGSFRCRYHDLQARKLQRFLYGHVTLTPRHRRGKQAGNRSLICWWVILLTLYCILWHTAANAFNLDKTRRLCIGCVISYYMPSIWGSEPISLILSRLCGFYLEMTLCCHWTFCCQWHEIHVPIECYSLALYWISSSIIGDSTIP